MKGEWYSYTPDGREVVVRRRGDFWHVRCGTSRSRSTNLDVALTQAIRAETDVLAHANEVDYPTWIRTVAGTLDPEA
jgi:hypothetical protein